MDSSGSIDSNSNINRAAPSDGIAIPTENPNVSASASVKVAVHIRPLIGHERMQGCKDCITVIPGEPQVQIGSHSFTFDHVYGSTAAPSSAIFEQCVTPLVDGLFNGYNATVLAYGQTGSGKTYTMGTGYTVGGGSEGIIPLVMETIFKKVEEMKHQADLQIRVSFIEILKEEVHDLLDPNPPASIKTDSNNVLCGKLAVSVKPPIQIREKSSGGITLAGVTEADASSQEEMASLLAQGSLCRATGSTNMNSQSSRSHAIFTITVDQKRKVDAILNGDTGSVDDGGEDFLSAKLHLVDLAGSERAKRTGADGLRFKEGVHINKGLLALGNVISALGDEKKRKEGGHVPYRDSKLTRLLQDSLGGNSRTVMIACISPADSNAEETLNTLKYANRARNIQNKPIVNRDPMAAEMQRMRQQLEYFQAELLFARAGGVSSDEVEVLKHKISWLEASNEDLRRELQGCRDNAELFAQHAVDAQIERHKLNVKLESLRNGKTWQEIDDGDENQDVDLLKNYLSKIQELESELQRLRAIDSRTSEAPKPSSFISSLGIENNGLVSSVGDFTGYADLQPMCVGRMIPSSVDESRNEDEEEEEEVVKEWEHTLLQDSLGKELQELNKRLEQKEAEMKSFANKVDPAVIKQHFEKKIIELEDEKKSLQKERDHLLAEVESLASASGDQTEKMQEIYVQKLKMLEAQIAELKKKQENQAQLQKLKQRSDEASKRLQEEILRIKQQKVQLQHKIKQESEQFRFWKALREKELLQLRKEGRRNEYEMHKLQALNQRQKMVLQRKTEEAALATKRLKEVLETRKAASRENTGVACGNDSAVQSNQKALQQWLEHELEVAARVHEVRSEYEKQSEARAAMAKELEKLRQEDEMSRKGFTTSQKQNGSPISACTPGMSPNARRAKIGLLESLLNTSSSTLVAMASQLSEAEERERAFSGRGRWKQLRSMGDAKNLLQYLFDAAACSRCQLRDKEVENRELKESNTELEALLRQNEIQRKEIERQLRLKEQAVDNTLPTSTLIASEASIKSSTEENSVASSSMETLELKHQQYRVNSCDNSNAGNGKFPYDLRKASRSVQSYGYTHRDEIIDILDEEDMDISDGDQSDEPSEGESDEDWDEYGEKQELKRSRVYMIGECNRASNAATEPLILDKKLCDSSVNGLQKKESLGSFSGDIVHGDNENKLNLDVDGENKLNLDVDGGCCSCSQSSGCKTKKCECKSGGSFCGSGCGCKPSRCTNRKTLRLGVEQLVISGSNKKEITETHQMDKADRQTHNKNAAKRNSTAGDDLARNEDKQKADQELAVYGATLLKNAFQEELQGHKLQADSNDKEEDGAHEEAERKNRRCPLSDIGNMKVTANVQGNAKGKQQKKWKKTLVQLVPMASQPSSDLSEIASTVSTDSEAVNNNASLMNADEPSVATAQDSGIPPRLSRSTNKNASSMPVLLKAQNTGAAEEEASANKSCNGPGSPGKHGQGMDGKENVR